VVLLAGGMAIGPQALHLHHRDNEQRDDQRGDE
jgi:hypothetical protein